MSWLLLDPDWPRTAPPDPAGARQAGSGVGGRHYLRLAAAGPWDSGLFGKNFGSGRAARAAALREFRRAAQLRTAGGPCPRPWAVSDDERGCVLWSEDLGPGAALERDAALASPGQLAACAQAAAALHDAGAIHGDLHLGNLLRRPGGGLVWTDLRWLRLAAAPGPEARAADLGRLLADLDPLPRRRLIEFSRAYLAAARKPAQPPSPAAAKNLARSAQGAALQRIREHQSNLFRRARRQLRGPHPEVWRDPGLREQSALLERAAEEASALKESSKSRVARATLPDGRAVVVKHYRPTRPLDPRDRLGRSKALRSLLAAEALIGRGLPAARPLAAWSRAGAGSWLVLEDLPQHQPLHEAILGLHGPARAELLRELARLLRRMHLLGVHYRDLKPSNVLVGPPGSGSPRLVFVDHDRNRFYRTPIPPEQARRDLAALHAGLPPEVRAAERMRALRSYDPVWTRREVWRRQLPPLLAEAAGRSHRWVPRALLGAGAGQAARAGRP